MKLESITLENWKSHRDTSFSFEDGVNALVGEMGAGKSSVLEAITFALYGETVDTRSRKVTLEQLIRRIPTQAGMARVELAFSHEGNRYTIERELQRGKGTVSSKLKDDDGKLLAGPQTTEVTEAVTDRLGIGFELFSEIIHSRQNAVDFFLSLSPRERREKIDDLLQLDRFEEARGNAVTVLNRVKDRYEDRRQDLAERREGFDEEKLAELRDEIEEKEEARESLGEEIESLHDREDELADAVEEIRQEKKRYENLVSSRDKVEGRIETIQDDIGSLEEGLEPDIVGMAEDDLVEMKDDLEDRLDEIKETTEQLQEVDTNLSVLDDRVDRLSEKQEELETKREKQDGLDTVKEKLAELETRKNEFDERHASLKAEKEQVTDSFRQLSGTDSVCPVCGHDLSDHDKEELREEKKQRLAELEEAIAETREKREGIQEQKDELEEKKQRLLELGDIDKRLQEIAKRITKTREKREELQSEKEELASAVADTDEETIRERIKQCEKGKELLEKREKLSRHREKLETLDETLDDVEFDQDRLDSLTEELNTVRSEIKVKTNRRETLEELVDDKEERLETLEEAAERIDELSGQVTKLEAIRQFLERLRDALEETQIELRKRFIERTNAMMQEVWSTVYPYTDYPSIRLAATDDYVLQLRDNHGSWLNAEAEVSGGERHTAALSLRIALSIVLAPGAGVLILDEPTHNLDARAIDDLVETLRSKVVDLVDQVVLITHETALESSVTGELYHLSKDHDRDGCTMVQQPSRL